MDAATIVSIAISVVFAIVGFYFSYISGVTLAKIETKLDGEVDSLKNLLNETHRRYEDLVRTSLSMLSQVNKSVQSGEGLKDSAKELNEALQDMQQKLLQDPASVLSPESKFDERKKHG